MLRFDLISFSPGKTCGVCEVCDSRDARPADKRPGFSAPPGVPPLARRAYQAASADTQCARPRFRSMRDRPLNSQVFSVCRGKARPKAGTPGGAEKPGRLSAGRACRESHTSHIPLAFLGESEM